MQIDAPDVTISATVGQVVVSSPAPTPTLSPAGPPPIPPYYPSFSYPFREPDVSEKKEEVSEIYYGKPVVIL